MLFFPLGNRGKKSTQIRRGRLRGESLSLRLVLPMIYRVDIMRNVCTVNVGFNGPLKRDLIYIAAPPVTYWKSKVTKTNYYIIDNISDNILFTI